MNRSFREPRRSIPESGRRPKNSKRMQMMPTVVNGPQAGDVLSLKSRQVKSPCWNERF